MEYLICLSFIVIPLTNKMDVIHESVFLAIDAILLGFCIKEYCSQKHIINALKVSRNLISILREF